MPFTIPKLLNFVPILRLLGSLNHVPIRQACPLPYGQQQKEITALLTLIQENLSNKPGARRARPSAWADFLRVLDARAINPETKKPYAKYQEIGFKVYGCARGESGKAKGQAGTAHADALRLMTDFPT